MKNYFILLVVFLVTLSCKKDTEPSADSTGYLLGTYVNIQKVSTDGFPITFVTKWTIKKSNNNHIRIEHHAVTIFEKPANYEGPYDPDNPVDAVIDKVQIADSSRFDVDKNIDWLYKGKKIKKNVVINAHLIGRDLSVYMKEASGKTVKEEQFVMYRE
jgi:pSer/pThr/pTyr-binding forkhead associated (FHA) protein